MTGTTERTLNLLPWMLVLLFGGALTFQMYGNDRYKLAFGTYLEPSANGGYYKQGVIRIDSKTGRTWVLASAPYNSQAQAQDQKWIEVSDPQK
jgi:hypothetical protein